MCCFITTVMLLGPRAGVLIWWLLRPAYYQAVFQSVVWPILGVLFAPWTTLMYLLVAPGGVVGFDWVWMSLAILTDLGTYAGGGYGNRDRFR